MTTDTTSSAPLADLGSPPNTFRLGAGVIPAAECVRMLGAGLSCPLSITNKHGQTGFYWFSLLRDGSGKVNGYRFLVDSPDGVMYDVPADLSSCECQDHVYRSAECKHLKVCKALKQRGFIS